MLEKKFITFLSDFGHTDDFVGTCHGVIKKIAPEVEIIDITHGIKPHGIRQGALILEQTLPYMPPSVIIAVVDPGVGVARKPVAIRTAEERFLVGPDNGLLSLAAASLGGAEEIVELICSAYSLPEVCRTFEGRDLSAPAAAHLCRGVSIDKLGPHVPVDELQQLELPVPATADGQITATVVYVDTFGNVQLYLSTEELKSIGASQGGKLEVTYGEEQWTVPYVYAFAEVEPDDLLVYEDSYGRVTFAMNQGNAAEIFQISEDDQMSFKAQ
jgi:S-adenosylmethionine hydrolase